MVWSEWLIILLVLAIPICVINLIFIILVCHRGSLGKLQNALLLSLGCSDFCAGFVAIPCTILCTLLTECKVCIASYFVNRFMMISSFIHLAAVIYERYLKIIHPFWFQSKEYTLLQSNRIVISIWTTSLLIALIPLSWWNLASPCESSDASDKKLQHFDYACLALFCLLLVANIYAFVRMFFVVRTHLLNINATAVQLRTSMDILSHPSENTSYHLEPDSVVIKNLSHFQSNLPQNVCQARSESQVSHVSTNSLRKQLLLKEAKIVLRFAILVFFFIVVWGTYFYISVRVKEASDVDLITQKILGVIRFLNPLIDPWVLTINNKDLKPKKKFCSCLKFRKDVRPKSNKSTRNHTSEFHVENNVADELVQSNI